MVHSIISVYTSMDRLAFIEILLKVVGPHVLVLYPKKTRHNRFWHKIHVSFCTVWNILYQNISNKPNIITDKQFIEITWPNSFRKSFANERWDQLALEESWNYKPFISWYEYWAFKKKKLSVKTFYDLILTWRGCDYLRTYKNVTIRRF